MAFERVATEAILTGKVRKEFAWQIISDYSRYANFMDNVDSVIQLERTPTHGKSEWNVTVEEAPLRWVETDYYDNENYEIRFESIDGDFENINGSWKVEDYQNQGIKIHFVIEYNLGIPVIEEVLGHILKEKMKTNIDAMIHAIKDELTRTQADDRRANRFAVNRYSNILLNGTPIRTYIVNISRLGMMFYYDGLFDAADISIEICGEKIEAEALFNDIKHKNCRVVFKSNVSEAQVNTIVDGIATDSVRAFERQLIEKDVLLTIGEEVVTVFLVNISRKGMLLRYDEAFEWHDDRCELCGTVLHARQLHHDLSSRMVRVEFPHTLNELDYTALLAKIKESDSGFLQLKLSL